MPSLSVAVLSFQIDNTNSKIQLLPAHDFRAKDGRPHGVSRWKINREIAAKLIRQMEQQHDKVVIDYEHQTLAAAKNGKPAPAAG